MLIIPESIHEDTKSEAEKKVFEWLRKSELEGVAIHSLELRQHVSKLYGEIDFLVITSRGLMCLEVKGGQVSVNQGTWQYTNMNGTCFNAKESPFKQARENKETLLNYVNEKYTKKNGNEIKECIYGFGVVLPDTVLKTEGIGIDHNIIYDYQTSSFDDYLDNLYEVWEKRLSDRRRMQFKSHGLPRLKKVHIELLVDLLLGKTLEFKCTKLNDEFLSTDQTLKKLSEEQFKVFQFGMLNRRILVNGGAGTGKTIIGIKYAVEKINDGNKVLYLCFNKLLASNIEQDISSRVKSTNYKVINFHDYLLEITNSDIPKDKALWNEFYTCQLPEKFIELECFGQYDTLIIDEGQDLLLEDYLICLDQLLIGGLNHGNWLITYDENQNIYLKESFDNGMKIIKSYNPFLGTLTMNYRNTRPINQKNIELTHLEVNRSVRVDGELVDSHYYNDTDHGQKRLKKIVKDLRKYGVKNQDIVILSPRRFEHSLLEGKRDILGSKSTVSPLQNKEGHLIKVDEDYISFSSIYSFKGLESHVVILVDVEDINESNNKLYYTGISRAKSKLIIMRKSK